MFAVKVPSENKNSRAILDFRNIEKLKVNEILEHVLQQASQAQAVSGYSRMHHRHSKTSSP